MKNHLLFLQMAASASITPASFERMRTHKETDQAVQPSLEDSDTNEQDGFPLQFEFLSEL